MGCINSREGYEKIPSLEKDEEDLILFSQELVRNKKIRKVYNTLCQKWIECDLDAWEDTFSFVFRYPPEFKKMKNTGLKFYYEGVFLKKWRIMEPTPEPNFSYIYLVLVENFNSFFNGIAECPCSREIHFSSKKSHKECPNCQIGKSFYVMNFFLSCYAFKKRAQIFVLLCSKIEDNFFGMLPKALVREILSLSDLVGEKLFIFPKK